MRTTIKQTLLAPALLLLAAVTLGLAGCTQGEDALQGAPGTVSRGGEPIRVSITEKPGFVGVTGTTGGSGTGTRATVGDDGAFGWSKWDRIYVRFTFDDAAATVVNHLWLYNPDNIGAYNYVPGGWNVLDRWETGISLYKGFVWPLGASKVTVRAFYTDCPYEGFGGDDYPKVVFNYTGSTGDHMTFMKDFSLCEDIQVDFRHLTTRLVFNGLKPATTYSLKAGGAALTFHTAFVAADCSLEGTDEQTFTSDADGKLVICAALDGKLDTGTHKVSLEVMEGGASGTSAGTVELTAKGNDTDGWKMDGYMYTVNFANGGAIDPESSPDLLSPIPITPGNEVYDVNGYWVTAPEADPAKTYTWDAANNTTTGPCVGHGDWRMPTMKDFEKMLSWTTPPLSWADDPNIVNQKIGLYGNESERVKWEAAFPYYNSSTYQVDYWSSDSHQNGDQAWSVFQDYPSGYANYHINAKTSEYNVRCVQPQKP